jgi:hypothetical protein
MYQQKTLVVDRYEFLVYRLLRKRLEAGDIFSRDSIRFRSFVGSCKIDDDLTKLKINEPTCHRIYELVWLKDRYLSLAARNFRDFLVGYFSERQK